MPETEPARVKRRHMKPHRKRPGEGFQPKGDLPLTVLLGLRIDEVTDATLAAWARQESAATGKPVIRLDIARRALAYWLEKHRDQLTERIEL